MDKKKQLYIDCFSGISGDMCVAALLDIIGDSDWLIKALQNLPLNNWEATVTVDNRNGITGKRFIVRQHQEEHAHRHLSDIDDILKEGLPPKAYEKAMHIFKLLAAAEARVHGMDIQKVHFHEVGAIDSIIDIAAVALCLDKLQAETITCASVAVGGGMIKCAHGHYPVPAPATAYLLEGFPSHGGPEDFELTTPTGAAILKAFACPSLYMPAIRVEKVGYGLGTKTFPDTPNALRIMMGEKETKKENHNSCLIETNIDDMLPEHMGWLFDALFAQKAQDVFITPIVMKKNRPGFKLSVLCAVKDKKMMEEFLYTHTTTLGMRCISIDKSVMPRHFETVNTRYGDVVVKVGTWEGKAVKFSPEFNDCVHLANIHTKPVKDIYAHILADGDAQILKTKGEKK